MSRHLVICIGMCLVVVATPTGGSGETCEVTYGYSGAPIEWGGTYDLGSSQATVDSVTPQFEIGWDTAVYDVGAPPATFGGGEWYGNDAIFANDVYVRADMKLTLGGITYHIYATWWGPYFYY